MSRRLPKPLSLEEIRRIRKVADPVERAAFDFLLETGLRSAEFASILAADMASLVSRHGGLASRIWPLRRAYNAKAQVAVLRVVGKGDKERVVPLTVVALRSARVLLAHPSSNGRADRLLPWADRTLRLRFERMGQRAGVRSNPHRTRHSLATQLVEAGNPIEVVADILGHSRIDTTRLYFEASERARAVAMGRRRRWLRRR
jgi:site-specific recombinase XerD